MHEYRIRDAVEGDVNAILHLISELAVYERLAHEAVATSEDMRLHLFGDHPAAEVLIVEESRDGAQHPIGFALFFSSFSTFLGKPGLYLEDLFVLEECRGRGIGKAMLKRLAAIAIERGCGRLEWSVLDWNKPAISFYQKLGAAAMDEWTVNRVTGDALEQLAGT